MTVQYSMVTTYGTLVFDGDIAVAWGNDVESTLDDKISTSTTTDQNIASNLIFSANKLPYLSTDPSTGSHATRKSWIDSNFFNKTTTTGQTVYSTITVTSGQFIVLNSDPTATYHAARKTWIDTNFLSKTGTASQTLASTVSVNTGYYLQMNSDPSGNNDLTRKSWITTNFAQKTSTSTQSFSGNINTPNLYTDTITQHGTSGYVEVMNTLWVNGNLDLRSGYWIASYGSNRLYLGDPIISNSSIITADAVKGTKDLGVSLDWWRYVYANSYYYHVSSSLISFDEHDDLAMLEAVTILKDKDGKPKRNKDGHVMEDPNSYPDFITNKHDFDNYKSAHTKWKAKKNKTPNDLEPELPEQFVHAGLKSSLMKGAINQLNKREREHFQSLLELIDDLQSRIKTLEAKN